MNTRSFSLGACVALAFSAIGCFAQVPALPERAEASFVVALGRAPTAAERPEWAATEKLSLPDLITRQRERLQGDAAAKRAVFVQAWRDAFGRAPVAAEFDLASGAATYAELMQRLIARLAAQPDEYRQVVDRAYRFMLGRAPYDEERAYWKGYPTVSYVVLVGCLENWARRNAPGLMVTSGVPAMCVNSDRLVTLRLSPAVAAEVRAACGLPPVGERSLALARGSNVLAPGAEPISSVGGVFFTVVGGPASVPAE